MECVGIAALAFTCACVCATTKADSSRSAWRPRSSRSRRAPSTRSTTSSTVSEAPHSSVLQKGKAKIGEQSVIQDWRKFLNSAQRCLCDMRKINFEAPAHHLEEEGSSSSPRARGRAKNKFADSTLDMAIDVSSVRDELDVSEEDSMRLEFREEISGISDSAAPLKRRGQVGSPPRSPLRQQHVSHTLQSPEPTLKMRGCEQDFTS